MPSAPTSVQVETIAGQPNQLLVMWQLPDTPNGLVTDYTVYCFGSDENGSDTERGTTPSSILFQNSISNTTVDGSESSAVVGGLDPYTVYDCSVVAYTSVGDGEPSSVESGVTDQSSMYSSVY